MIKKITVLIFFLLISDFNKINAKDKIILLYKVENELITNVDVENEKNYLSTLNPQFKNLDEDLKEKISVESLIKELIKQNELLRYFKLDENIKFLDNYIKNFYEKMGFNNLNEFKNYLINNSISFENFRKKINIEVLWNQLIYDKYNMQVNVNIEKIEKILNQKKNSEEKLEYNLSEILFRLDPGESLINKFSNIEDSISTIGFENTASLYSISESSKIGGKIGWIAENNLSKNIKEEINKLNYENHTEVIKINNGFLILKLNEKRISTKKFNKKEEFKKLINIETDKQLNNFSKIYFDKIKINILINEF